MNGLLYGLLGGVEAGGNAGANILRDNAKAARDKAYKDQEWQREKAYKDEQWEKERNADKGRYGQIHYDDTGQVNTEGRGLLVGNVDTLTGKQDIDASLFKAAQLGKGKTYDWSGKGKKGSGSGSGSGDSGSDLYVLDEYGNSKKVSFTTDEQGNMLFNVVDAEGNINTRKVGAGSAEATAAGQQFADDMLSETGWFGKYNKDDLMEQYGVSTENELRHALEVVGKRNHIIRETMLANGLTPQDAGQAPAGQQTQNKMLTDTEGNPIKPAGTEQAAPPKGSVNVDKIFVQKVQSGELSEDMVKNTPEVYWKGEKITGEEAWNRIMQGRGGKQAAGTAEQAPAEQEKAGIANALNGGEATPQGDVSALVAGLQTGATGLTKLDKRSTIIEGGKPGTRQNRYFRQPQIGEAVTGAGQQIGEAATAIGGKLESSLATMPFHRYIENNRRPPRYVIERAMPYLQGRDLEIAEQILALNE